MDNKTLQNDTGSYDEFLLEQLKDPQEARAYLEASLEAYEEDGDTAALLLAIRDVATAQGGIAKLIQTTQEWHRRQSMQAHQHRLRSVPRVPIPCGLI
jgi:DNA-binding phage protein